MLGPEADPCEDPVAAARRISDKAIEKRPKPGEDQDLLATWYVYVRSRVMELLAGTIAEDILDPKSTRLNCGSDIKIANIFAKSICSQAAVPSFLDYCKMEARSILKDQWNTVLSVAKELELHKTLTGEQVDLIISSTISKDQAAVEKPVVPRWQR